MHVQCAEIRMFVKPAMVLVGKTAWEIIMTTMELVSIRYLVQIVVMDIQKEMAFAIFVNKVTTKGYF